MDFVFKVHKDAVFRTLGFEACRQAVLWPLAHRRGQKPGMQVPEALDAVMGQWRARLIALRAAGWKPLEPATALQYMRNCPPCGVTTGTKAFCCHRLRICPWCYSREIVLETYKAIRWAIEHDLAGVSMLRLIGVRREVTVDLRKVSVDRCVADASKAKFLEYRQLTDDCGVFVPGGVFNITLAPGLTPDTLVARRAAILLVSEIDAPFQSRLIDSLAGTEFYEPEGSFKAKIEQLVPWAMAYPVNLLRQSVATTVAILHETAKTRAKLFSTVGVFSNAQIRFLRRASAAAGALDKKSSRAADHLTEPDNEFPDT